MSKNKNKRITVKDVAAALGVNPSTVSRALSPEKQHLVSDRVIELVEKKSREMGYTANPMATALKCGATKTIGMMIPDILNPMFPPLVHEIQQLTNKLGYTLTLAYTENNQELALEELKRLIARNVDGIILASAFRKDPTVDYCIEMGKPLVQVNRVVDKQVSDQVLVDDREGIYVLFEHLYSLGHRKIAHIAGPADISPGLSRRHAFLSIADMFDIPASDAPVIQAEAFTEQAGRNAMEILLSSERDVTAVVATNDLVALGCIEAIEASGKRVPGDISVTGFNDMPYLDWFRIPLTTVSLPQSQLGDQAVRMLLSQIRKESDSSFPRKVLLQPKLVVRKSTGKPIKH
ncbi:LacI family DNA-binding transcriptional regulator [Grimontia hollisae]|uniref:Putative transcriptional regulatory protein LacI family n=1 Tax=Grimontia hollisae CIP 101886 TaxID=675812 RepID=D0IA63_GRIHO|nr:LacI family DNA-binding transcriptional regulator [Grimontia hollisae]EEY70781.1 putative transcriptional regulatory protein LacI family [Grimontia hollisae CIP 101886]STO44833.1 HTH-type transcriptional repressor CytR [Grimontia hollisae]